MSDNSFLYALGAFAIIVKVVVIGNIVHRRRHPLPQAASRSASGSTTVPNSADQTMAEGHPVLVEDPMTQRILRTFDNESQISFSEIKVPPPVYTPKDQHLEFSGYDAPPPFSAVAGSPIKPSRIRGSSSSSSSGGPRSQTRSHTIVVTTATPSTTTPAAPVALEQARSSLSPRRPNLTSPRRPDLPSPLQRRQYPISAICPSIVVHM